MSKSKLKPCQVKIRFNTGSMTEDQIDALEQASLLLSDAGLYFDEGKDVDDNGKVTAIEWEFDHSLEGPAEVLFKRFLWSSVFKPTHERNNQGCPLDCIYQVCQCHEGRDLLNELTGEQCQFTNASDANAGQ